MTACPLCSSTSFHPRLEGTDRLFRTTEKRFQVVECDGCSLLRLHPWPAPSELNHYYPDSYWFDPGEGVPGRLEEMYRRLVLRDHVHFVERALSCAGPGPVLDVGCGGALFARMMRERGHPTVGLDYSAQAGRVAWHTNGVPAVAGDITVAPFPEQSFACITMFHVLEHLYDPAAYLLAIRELLRAGGRLVVQVPNAASWQFAFLGRRWNGVDIPRHLIDFKASHLEKLLDRSGFTVMRKKQFSLRDNPAGLASSLAPGLDPMARKVRGASESAAGRTARNLAYLSLVACALPFALAEAAAGAGSTVMIEAAKA